MQAIERQGRMMLQGQMDKDGVAQSDEVGEVTQGFRLDT